MSPTSSLLASARRLGGAQTIDCLDANGTVDHLDVVHVSGVESLYFLFVGLVMCLVVLQFQLSFLSWVPYAAKVFVLGGVVGLIDIATGHGLGILSTSIDMWFNIDPELFKFVFLPALVFQDAMNIDTHMLYNGIWQLLLVAISGVLLTTFMMAYCAQVLLPYQWSWYLCVLFASALSAIDPIAISAMMMNTAVSRRLGIALQGESHLGSIVGLIIFDLYFQLSEWAAGDVAVTASMLAGKIATLCLVGIVVGGVFGALSQAILYRSSDSTSLRCAIIQFTVTLLLAYASFVVTEYDLESNGLTATFVAALVIATYGWPTFANPKTMRNVWNFIGYISTSLVFLLSGVIVAEVLYDSFAVTEVDVIKLRFGARDILNLFIMYAILMALRAVFVFLCFPFAKSMHFELSLREAVVLSISGVRGAVPLILSVTIREQLPLTEGTDLAASQVTFFIMGIVFLTVLLNGSMIRPVASLLGILERSRVEKLLLHYVDQRFKQAAREAYDSIMSSDDFGEANEPVIRRHVTSLAGDPDAPAEFRTPHGKPSFARVAHTVMSIKAMASRKQKQSHKRNRAGSHRAVVRTESPAELFRRRFNREQFKEDLTLLMELRELFLSAVRSCYWEQIDEGVLPKGSRIAHHLLSSVDLAMDKRHMDLSDFDELRIQSLNHAQSLETDSCSKRAFPWLQTAWKRRHEDSVGLSTYIVSCYIDAHEKARSLLLEYIGSTHAEGMVTDDSARESGNAMELSEVHRVVSESEVGVNRAHEYLETIAERFPDKIKSTQNRKLISIILHQQQQYASELYRHGILDHSDFQLYLIHIRKDSRRMRKLNVPGKLVELEEIRQEVEHKHSEMVDEDVSGNSDLDDIPIMHTQSEYVTRRKSSFLDSIFKQTSNPDMPSKRSRAASRQRAVTNKRSNTLSARLSQEVGSVLGLGRMSKELAIEEGAAARLSVASLGATATKRRGASGGVPDSEGQGSTTSSAEASRSGNSNDDSRESGSVDNPGDNKAGPRRTVSESATATQEPGREESGRDERAQSQGVLDGGGRRLGARRLSQQEEQSLSEKRLALLRVLQDAENRMEYARMSKLYRKLGNVYMESQRPDEALESYNLSLAYATRKDQLKSHIGIGKAYFAMAQSKKAGSSEGVALNRRALEAARMVMVSLEQVKDGSDDLDKAQVAELRDLARAFQRQVIQQLRSQSTTIESSKYFWLEQAE